MASSKQKVDGTGNFTSAGDINIKYINNNEDVLRFFDEDIKNVIIKFSKIANHTYEVPDDVIRINVEDKNRKNDLSNKYFEKIKQNMHYFEQIDVFLKSTINAKYLKMYEDTIYELNQRITIHRDDFDRFDYIFEQLYNCILENNSSEIKGDRRLIWVFLHYMYWKCDIGEE